MKRIGVVIDSACDLPADYINQKNILVLPINLYLGDEHLLDVRDPDTTIDFYDRYARKRKQAAETSPPDTEQIIESLLEHASHFDRLLIVTVTSTRSKVFENVSKAQLPLLNALIKQRREDNVGGSVLLRVHDSKTMFTGQAVLVHEMVRLLQNDDLDFNELCLCADEFSEHIHAYLVPNDLFYVRERARQKGEKSVSWLSYQAGTLLNIKPVIHMHQGNSGALTTARGFDSALEKLIEIATTAIDDGLKTNTVVMSYAGDPKVMGENRLIREFRAYAITKGVEVLESVMSTTAGLNVGPGAVSLAYAV
jgi:DegV family protein with EDD domain